MPDDAETDQRESEHQTELKRLLYSIKGKIDPEVHVIRRKVDNLEFELKDIKRLIYLTLALIFALAIKIHFWP